MEPITEKIKLIYILLIRQISKTLFLIPQRNNQVLFESFSGEGYSCNPKYISEALKEKYGESIRIIWAIKDEVMLPKDVIPCKFRSLKHLIYRITSKVYVCNYLQLTEIPKRKTQIEIQTWHGGGCYKKIGNEETARGFAYIVRRNMQVKETDYFIASSKYFEDEVIRKQLGYSGKVLQIGMPRNDCFFRDIDMERIHRLKEKLKICLDDFVVLYAPTWREGLDSYSSIDCEMLKRSVKKRFGKNATILFRAHIYGKENSNEMINVSSYPDMQELLYMSDALITDYSSSMWDYSITEKPCFLYVPDLERYTGQRGFDKDIHLWGFPVCENNKQLCDAIDNFDKEKFEALMKKHQEDLETYEHGSATEAVVKLISGICELRWK